MKHTQIISLISRIYPDAAKFAALGYAGQSVPFFSVQESEHNPGVFFLLENPEFVIGYLACEHEAGTALLAQVEAGLRPYLQPAPRRPVYVNVYGRNPQAMAYVQGLGFQLEMHGVKLARSQPVEGPGLPLDEIPFEQVDLEQAARLIDAAYADLSRCQGLETNHWQKRPERFAAYCARFVEQGGFRAYFLQERLVGICFFRGSYIADLAVDQARQGQGLGREILRRVSAEILACGHDQVALDVAMSNIAALRFYERLAFQEIGCFADHCLLEH